MPEFVLTDSEGREVSDAFYVNKRLVVSFLAPWSVLSVDQMPLMAEMAEQLPRDTEVVGVLVQESAGSLQTFMHRGGYEINLLADETGSMATDFGVTTLPQHYLVNSSGKVVEIVNGVMTAEELLERLELVN